MNRSRTGMAASVVVLAWALGGCARDIQLPDTLYAKVAMVDGADRRLADLQFLEGNWIGWGDDGISEEIWSGPCGTGMIGAFREVGKDGTMAVQEAIAISAEADGVFMRLRHFDAGLTPWKSEAEGPIVLRLESAEGNRAVFIKVSGSRSLDSIVYERVGNDSLGSAVVFTPESGRETLKFVMRRVR